MTPFIRYFKLEEHDEENAESYAVVDAAAVKNFGSLDFTPTSNDRTSPDILVLLQSAKGWRTSLGTNETSTLVFVIRVTVYSCPDRHYSHNQCPHIILCDG